MRKLVVNTFVTLDGVMQAPGGPEEDRTGGFALGGWSVNHWDGAMEEAMGELMGKPFELLLGRGTYEIFAAHWPFITDDPAAGLLNSAKKYVTSTTLTSVDWNNSELLEGDVPQRIRDLKTQDGPELQVHGSWGLIQTLLQHDLIDEFRLMIFPIVVGSGKRLFDNGTVPAAFTATKAVLSSTGVIIANYERAGEVPVGSFALGEPSELECQRREKLGNA